MDVRLMMVAGAMALACVPVTAGSVGDLARLELQNAKVERADFKGKPALRMTEEQASGPSGGGALAVLTGSDFRDGVIEVDAAGLPITNAASFARGFIGVKFRIQRDRQRFEQLYIRPENGRSLDQVRRNHSVQYVAGPDWPWERLRTEEPSKYEAYTDLRVGEWTHLRIVVRGRTASLYVDNAAQPCLIVQDMKNGESAGAVGLWIGPETEGYFRNLRVMHASTPKPAS